MGVAERPCDSRSAPRNAVSNVVTAQWRAFRPCERILIAYFIYTAVLAYLSDAPPLRRLLAAVLPLFLCWLGTMASRNYRPWSRVARDWAPLGLILVGYWQLEWFTGSAPSPWQGAWLEWDRTLLDNVGLKHAIESFGGLFPSLLETIYLLLYTIPPLAMGAIYLCGKRHHADRFLATLLLGSLGAYALLPHFRLISPRLAFPETELPHFAGAAHSINVWLLDHLDISTSVFPSGHVAVAFSAAFGILRVLPERRKIWAAAFGVAALVWTATIYCRYHYAADGLASLLISMAAWRLTEAYNPNA